MTVARDIAAEHVAWARSEGLNPYDVWRTLFPLPRRFLLDAVTWRDIERLITDWEAGKLARAAPAKAHREVTGPRKAGISSLTSAAL